MVGLEGHGHRGHGVILNAQGQIVAHIWGRAQVTNPDFKFVPAAPGVHSGLIPPKLVVSPGTVPPSLKGFGDLGEEASLF